MAIVRKSRRRKESVWSGRFAMWVLAKDVADKLFMIVNGAMTSIVMFVIDVLLQFGITVYPRRLRSEAGQHYGTLHASIHFDWILLQLQSCRSG